MPCLCKYPHGTCSHEWITENSATTTTAGTDYYQWMYDNTTTTGATDLLWRGWVQGHSTAVTVRNTRTYGQWIVQAEADEARLAALEEAAQRLAERTAQQAAENREQRRQALAEVEEANATAKKLLFGYLNRRQRKELEQHGYFDVVVKRRWKHGRYRIHSNNASGNVRKMVNGQWAEAYCVHVPYELGLPLYDQLLAQMLLLTWDADVFRALANVSDPYGRIISRTDPRAWQREPAGQPAIADAV